MPKAKTNKNNSKKKAKDESTDDTSSGGGKAQLKGAQKINVRHILCEKEAKKNEALAELEKGKSFDAVARLFSEDKGKAGGALGWVLRANVIQEFGDVAWKLPPSSTTSPILGQVKTKEGHHIIMVEGRQ